jgi:hypothetical protein
MGTVATLASGMAACAEGRAIVNAHSRQPTFYLPFASSTGAPGSENGFRKIRIWNMMLA